MSANIEVLMGEVATNSNGQKRDVELLLQSFLRALAEEQRLIKGSPPDSSDEANGSVDSEAL
jgi:hypothetical protein